MQEYTPTHSRHRATDYSAVYDFTQDIILRHTRHQNTQWGSHHTSAASSAAMSGLSGMPGTAANCSHCLPVTYSAPLSPPGLQYGRDPGDTTSPEYAFWNTSFYNESLWSYNGSSNVTGGGSDRTAGHLVQDVALGIVLGLLSMLTFVGNAMVLHAVRTEKRLQTVSNMFIISLAIADLIVGLIVMPISAIYIFTEEWLFGVVVCQFWIGVDYTASTASILNLFILSLDRYWSVTSPLRYMRKRTKKRALIMISVVWFVSSLWLIPIIGWHHFEHGGVRTVPGNICDTEYATNTALKIITGILNYYLPLAVMYGLYTKIFLEIRKRSKFELGQRTSGCGMKETHVPATSSLTDSDHRSNCDSEQAPDNYSPYVSSPEQRKFLNPRLATTTTTEYETETSEDELARLHRGKYTNLTLVRVAAEQIKDPSNHSNPSNSDIEVKVEYFYDESVVDPQTERLHRFYEEHSLPVRKNSERSRGTAETSLSSPTPPGSVVVNDADVPSIVARNTQTNKFSKFGPQNRRHFVRKKQNQRRDKCEPSSRLNSLGRILHIRNKLGGQRETHDVDSALRRHAARWRERFLKHQTKRGPRSKKQPKNHLKHRAKKASKKLNRPSAALAKEIKAAKQLGVIMGAFTLCFCPYFVLFMVVAFCDGCISAGLMSTVTWVGYLNSTMNPFLYPLCNMQFRRKFRKMLSLKTKDDRIIINTNNSRYFTPRTSIAAYESRCNDY